MTTSPDLGALFGASETTTFLGLTHCEDLTRVDASSAFIGAPCATPYGAVGAYARNGPASLRKAIGALTANIDRHNFDLGGPTFPPGTVVTASRMRRRLASKSVSLHGRSPQSTARLVPGGKVGPPRSKLCRSMFAVRERDGL